MKSEAKRSTWGTWMGAGALALGCAIVAVRPAFVTSPALAAEPAQTVAMDPTAVTLQIQLPEDITEGKFHSSQARILDADIWGLNQQWHADAQGFIGHGGKTRLNAKQPGKGKGQRKGKKASKPGQQAAPRRPADARRHAQARRRCRFGDRYRRRQCGHPLAGRRI